MKLLNIVVIASCALQVTARLHSRDLLRPDRSDLCEHDECIVDNASPDTLLFRRKGPIKIYGTDRDGAGGAGNRDNGSGSSKEVSAGDGPGIQNSGTSGDKSPVRDKTELKTGKQEQQVKDTFRSLNVPKIDDRTPRKFDKADDDALLVLETRKNEPDDLYEGIPDYSEAAIRERAGKVLQPGQRSKDVQDKVDAKLRENYVVRSDDLKPGDTTLDEWDAEYARLFTARQIDLNKVKKVTVHSKVGSGETAPKATAVYYVDEDMRVVVCGEAFAGYDTNAYVKGASGGKMVKSPDAKEKAVMHSDMMWAILNKVGGAETSTKVKNIKEVIQHDVINLGTVLTLFRNSKADNRAASDIKSFKLAEHPEWAGTANVSPTLFLKKDHPEVAGNRKPTEVWTQFVKNKFTSDYDLILSTMFKND